MSITSRINEMSSHIEQAYDELQGLGADLTNVNKNIENISMVLDDIYDSMPQVSGEGTSLTLDDTRVGKIKSTLKGNTSQTTYSGKNLLPNERETDELNGITVTKRDDGTYLVNGTASADVSMAINLNTFIPMSGTWRMLGCPSGGSASTYMLSAYVGYWGEGSPNIDTGNGTNITYTGNVKVRFYIKSGTTCNNLIFKPMLTTDTSTTINDFEPYTGGQASPNPDYPQDIHVVSGDNEINIVGKNLFDKTTITENQRLDPSGNNNYDENCDLSDYIEIQPNTTYTRNITASVYECICFYTINKTFISRDTTHATTTSPNNAYYVRISCYKTNLDTLQLEKGSSASEYEPYQGNTYNIDLGVENLWGGFSNSFSRTDFGVQFTANQDGTITANGTATNTATSILLSEATSNGIYKTLQKGTYTVSGGGAKYNVEIYDKNNVVRLGGIDVNGSKVSFTINEETQIVLRIQVASGVTINETIKLQLQKGSSANTYTPYGTTPIELAEISTYNDEIFRTCGKNLLPNNATTQTINGVTFTINNGKSVTLNGTASAIADLYVYGSSTDTGEYIYIPKGTYSISEPSSGWFYIGREKTLGAVVGNSALLNALSSQDCYFYGFIIRATSGSSFSNLTLYPQIEKGSTATEYNPYGTGEWYYKEAIKKVVLNGTETISAFDATSLSGSYQATFGITARATTTDKVAISDKFISALLSDRTTKTNIIYSYSDGYLRIATNVANTMAGFKTWLETNTPKILLEAETPTYIKITSSNYPTLYSQLEAIYNAQSKENQTNISQVNNDLPFIISASALKEWQENTSLNSTLSMVNPLSLGNTLNTQEIDNNTQPIEVDNIEPLEEEENEES